METAKLQSLRYRLLVPQIVVAAVAAVAVAATSYWLGYRWAKQDVDKRLSGIRASLESASYPLTPSVLESLAKLTQTEIVTRLNDGRILASTLAFDDPSVRRTLEQLELDSNSSANRSIGGVSYVIHAVTRLQPTSVADPTASMLIFFDERDILAVRWRAALLPLVTGLSTIVLLGTLSVTLSTRLVGRLAALRERVERIADGNFNLTTSDPTQDEIGQLGRSVDSMAKQLDQLWKAVNRQQSEKLLHQIASGMAHQLRNSLTGARMAIELHARHCSQGRQEELQVAITQLEQLEEYIRRLLWVGTGQPTQDQPTCIAQCIEDLKSSLGSVARHLQRQLVWSVSEVPEQFVIKDGPIFSAALTNLIWNAMQAGRNVLVSATMVADDDHRQLSLLEVVVTDDGPGIPDSIAGSLFEPFVSTKPEGLGLGLPFVQRAAEILGGEVQWRRREESTQFILRIRVSQEAPK